MTNAAKIAVVLLLAAPSAASADPADSVAVDAGAPTFPLETATGSVPLPPWEDLVREWLRSDQAQGPIRTMGTFLLAALVPALFLLTTSFVRISVVLGLLRQAIGPSLFLSQQVVTTLAMILTVTVMSPVWRRAYDEGIRPYQEHVEGATWDVAWTRGVAPIREFMTRQIEAAGHQDDVRLFTEYTDPSASTPASNRDISLAALLPAYLISELKTAFLIGFRVYLPFLVIDLIVAAITTALGMSMLSPAALSLPLKLIVFVLADGWHLVVQSLLQSF